MQLPKGRGRDEADYLLLALSI